MANWEGNKDAALTIAWGVYRTWAKTSRAAADRLRRSRRYILALSIAGALLSTAAQFVEPTPKATDWISMVHRGLGSLGALAIALAAYLTRELLSEEAQRKWLRSRSVAEGAKSESYLFRLRCLPYQGDDAIQKLVENVKSHEKLASGITHDVMTNVELVEKLPTGELAVEGYLKDRVQDQITFYNKRISEYLGYVAASRKITIVLGAAAVVLSVIALKDKGAQLVPLFATLTVVLGSAMSAGQYGYLITSYQATADQLAELNQEWSLSPNPQNADVITKLATACESAICSENSAWMAKLSEKIQQQQRAPASAPDNITDGVSGGVSPLNGG